MPVLSDAVLLPALSRLGSEVKAEDCCMNLSKHHLQTNK